MLRAPVRLQGLPCTSVHQAWTRHVQPVDGSSDIHAVGAAVSSVYYIRIIKTSERRRPVLATV